MSNKVVRIKDIAEKAGVSTGTVDRVLHDRGRVSQDVKEKVLKIIKEMEYEPNYSARALGSNKIYNIAALVPSHSSDSYWNEAIMGIEKAEKELKQYGITVTRYSFNLHEVGSFVGKAKEVTLKGPDGIILAPLFYKETLPFFDEWNTLGIPFIIFNTQISEYNPLSYIGQDSYQSGLLAGRLLSQLHADPCSILIAHIDEDIGNATHLMKKEQGFRNYFSHNNLSGKYTLHRVELQRKDYALFQRQMDDLIENNPELQGIYVTTSKGYAIATYLEQRHIKGLKLVCYDLVPKNIHFLNRGIISFLINQNPRGQGYWSVNHMADYLVFKKKVPVIKYMPLDIIAKENLNYFIHEE
ncbi:MAG: substrate-binding domain-containing protein [Arcticibacter sp.]